MSASSAHKVDNRAVRAECPIPDENELAAGITEEALKAFGDGAPAGVGEGGYPTPLKIMYHLVGWCVERRSLKTIQLWVKHFEPSWFGSTDHHLDERQAEFTAGYGIARFILSQPAVTAQTLAYRDFDRVRLLELRTHILKRSRKSGANLQAALCLMMVGRLLSTIGTPINLDELRFVLLQALQIERTSSKDARRKALDRALERAWAQILALRNPPRTTPAE